jgi:hypothetical protein
MTVENLRLFCDAVKRAALLHHEDEWLESCLFEFSDMAARMERGEPQLSKSDWVEVVPPKVSESGQAGLPDNQPLPRTRAGVVVLVVRTAVDARQVR